MALLLFCRFHDETEVGMSFMAAFGADFSGFVFAQPFLHTSGYGSLHWRSIGSFTLSFFVYFFFLFCLLTFVLVYRSLEHLAPTETG
jgi:hypothetical protein